MPRPRLRLLTRPEKKQFATRVKMLRKLGVAAADGIDLRREFVPAGKLAAVTRAWKQYADPGVRGAPIKKIRKKPRESKSAYRKRINSIKKKLRQ